MTGHPTLGPATTLVVCSGAAHDATATAFADLICADHQLLAAEFDAIITANFPDPAEHPLPRDPGFSVATATDREARHGHTIGYGSRRPARGVAGTPHPQPRERGPPTRHTDRAARNVSIHGV